MKLFDRVEQSSVDRRELQLAIFSLSVIAVLIVGIAILMYPTVMSHPVIFTERTSKVFFFGFCALSVLLLGYLIDRQIVVRRLMREVLRAQVRYTELHQQAGRDLLETLSGLNHFQDRLIMEFKRAVNCRDDLSVMVVRLTPTETLANQGELIGALGDAVKALSRKLRREDSLYNFSSGTFGILLPGLKVRDARLVANRLAEGLSDAAGAVDRFTHDVKIFNYPQHAATASELESAVMALLPAELITEPVIAGAFEISTQAK